MSCRFAQNNQKGHLCSCMRLLFSRNRLVANRTSCDSSGDFVIVYCEFLSAAVPDVFFHTNRGILNFGLVQEVYKLPKSEHVPKCFDGTFATLACMDTNRFFSHRVVGSRFRHVPSDPCTYHGNAKYLGSMETHGIS